MSTAWYIVLEQEIPGFDHGVNGKSLSRAGTALDGLAGEIGIEPLMSFFSTSQDDLRAFSEEVDIPLPQEKWFSAERGLQTVEALIERVREADIDRKEDVMKDLGDFHRVLTTAKGHGIRWHLAIDY